MPPEPVLELRQASFLVIKAFLKAVGSSLFRFPRAGILTLREELFVLDLQRRHFGQWIRHILKRSGKTIRRHSIGQADVQHFLMHWGDSPVLWEAELTQSIGVAPTAKDDSDSHRRCPQPQFLINVGRLTAGSDDDSAASQSIKRMRSDKMMDNPQLVLETTGDPKLTSPWKKE